MSANRGKAAETEAVAGELSGLCDRLERKLMLGRELCLKHAKDPEAARREWDALMVRTGVD